MLEVTLNTREIALLKQWLRRGDSDEAFHQLLSTLDTLLNDESGILKLPPPILEKLRAKGTDRKAPAHQALLMGVFSRSLGKDLTGEERVFAP